MKTPPTVGGEGEEEGEEEVTGGGAAGGASSSSKKKKKKKKKKAAAAAAGEADATAGGERLNETIDSTPANVDSSNKTLRSKATFRFLETVAPNPSVKASVHGYP